MAQVPMRIPQGGNTQHLIPPSPQHHLQTAPHHHIQNTGGPEHHILNTGGQQYHIQGSGGPQHHIQGAPQHHIQSTGGLQHHIQSTGAPQHHIQQHIVQGSGQHHGSVTTHHIQPSGVQHHLQPSLSAHHIQTNGRQHHIQANKGPHHIPSPGSSTHQQQPPPQHQTIQGGSGHSPGSLSSSNHVMMSQYTHPPTSLPGVLVSVNSATSLPPQHIHQLHQHTGSLVDGGGGYSTHPNHHPGVPSQYGRPPPVMLKQTLHIDLNDGMNTKEKTPMCLVNELARFNKIQHQYKLTDESGPAHKKNFTVCLKIGDKEEFLASGPSIKKAQHAAAAIALEKTQLKHPAPKLKPSKSANVTPTVELNAMAMKRGEPASYSFIPPSSTNQFSHPLRNRTTGRGFPPVFCVQLKVGKTEYIGEGATAQAARHCAASQALKALKDKNSGEGKSKLDPTSNPFIPGVEYDDLKSPISLVHEVALKRNLPVTFTVVRENGPPHMRMFLTKCSVGDLYAEAEGNGKKVSKKRAAEMMLSKLKQLPPVASITQPKPRKQTMTKKKSRNLIKEENDETADSKQTVNPISRLIQIQQAKKEKEPVYTLIVERGLPRRREFFMKVTVGANSAVGSGPNKKVAKRAAAEALLQLTGYSRPGAVPTKPALKSPGEPSSDKPKKLTFVDDLKIEDGTSAGSVPVSSSPGGKSSTGSGPAGRQLVPGLLYIDDKTANINGKVSSLKVSNGKLSAECKSPSQSQVATIAKELLDAGTSPTADKIAKEAGTNLPAPVLKLPTSGQGVSSKEQLSYLAQILGVTVTYDDFPKKGEYLTLVSLSTNPAQVSHGSGPNLESSHNNAAHTALKSLAATGLDTIAAAGTCTDLVSDQTSF
ncbi:double-stranded RNA-binding protein Staufen homolog 2 isoform X2 [Eurytemora carolleeae]|uniref:double-stranded RNA-binding protein Staufen homolog 2 isoform X2 n=1 Tax=Eurytemora carolleeae TaxID=1294199 RepID=UPI000C77DE83|nr:double-stranded RNA-binding protein Staufen homolog 2 isoform X2 [Eurytemora carolleeae]|eukprot:XP_023326146.1 double-stranded RNA-binding protein Staufen homolog 2-like isoform X2 [Eurytemora affinis]